MSTNNIHPQVRAIVALLCEGFNVPSSETKILAFSDKLKNPHIPALKGDLSIKEDKWKNSLNVIGVNIRWLD